MEELTDLDRHVIQLLQEGVLCNHDIMEQTGRSMASVAISTSKLSKDGLIKAVRKVKRRLYYTVVESKATKATMPKHKLVDNLPSIMLYWGGFIQYWIHSGALTEADIQIAMQKYY